MKLINFHEQNIVIAEHQPQYKPLPAFRSPRGSDGRVVCCWLMSWRERLMTLITGRIWHQVLTFDQALQPQKLTVEKPEMSSEGADASR